MLYNGLVLTPETRGTSTMRNLLPLLLYPLLSLAAPSPAGWNFVQNGTTGIVALEAIVVSPTLAVLFDRVQNDPLQINGAGAWGVLWNFETNTATPLSLLSDSFCASGGLLSNGTLVSSGLGLFEQIIHCHRW